MNIKRFEFKLVSRSVDSLQRDKATTSFFLTLRYLSKLKRSALETGNWVVPTLHGCVLQSERKPSKVTVRVWWFLVCTCVHYLCKRLEVSWMIDRQPGAARSARSWLYIPSHASGMISRDIYYCIRHTGGYRLRSRERIRRFETIPHFNFEIYNKCTKYTCRYK